MLCVTSLLVGTAKGCSYISHNLVPVFADFNATVSFRNDCHFEEAYWKGGTVFYAIQVE